MEAITTVSVITPDLIQALRGHGYSLKRAGDNDRSQGKPWKWKYQNADGLRYPCDSFTTQAAAWADAVRDFEETISSKKWRVTHFNGTWRIEHPTGASDPKKGQAFSLAAILPGTFIDAEGKAFRLCVFLNQYGFRG